MKVLFVHQNFPGQFKHLAPALATRGHEVRALSIRGSDLPGVAHRRYTVAAPRDPLAGAHPLAEFDTKRLRGQACAAAALELAAAGFAPDVIVANPGWGESLFLKDVWPEARVLNYCEFYYAAEGLDVGFDPEFGAAGAALHSRMRVRLKNTHLLQALEAMDRGIAPTFWQRAVQPPTYRERIDVIFDGIDTVAVAPDPAAELEIGGRRLRAGDEVLTFVNRNLEPYRGYHVFMRALPEILERRPQAVAVIVGGDGVSYGAAAPAGKTWKRIFLDEVGARLDPARVFFVGNVPYATYLKILQVSACHAYLTYPFVLSWSCVEALAAGCLVVGSRTAPVTEVIEDGVNGLLVDFFDVAGWADTIGRCLAAPQAYAALRRAARAGAQARYDRSGVCLPAQIALIEGLIPGGSAS